MRKDLCLPDFNMQRWWLLPTLAVSSRFGSADAHTIAAVSSAATAAAAAVPCRHLVHWRFGKAGAHFYFSPELRQAELQSIAATTGNTKVQLSFANAMQGTGEAAGALQWLIGAPDGGSADVYYTALAQQSGCVRAIHEVLAIGSDLKSCAANAASLTARSPQLSSLMSGKHAVSEAMSMFHDSCSDCDIQISFILCSAHLIRLGVHVCDGSRGAAMDERCGVRHSQKRKLTLTCLQTCLSVCLGPLISSLPNTCCTYSAVLSSTIPNQAARPLSC